MVRTVERHPAAATHLAESARSASTVSRIETGHRTPSASGEAAEFATMTPHSVAALDGPAEVVMLFDRDGRGVHLTASGSDSPV
jgi:hypothetical protein